MDKRKNNQSLLLGVVGIAIQIFGIPVGVSVGTAMQMAPELATLLGVGTALIGTVILIGAMCLYAQAKERSGWWGLFGLLGIIGLIVLSVLEDREKIRQDTRHLLADISLPPTHNSVGFLCFGCSYTLNGVIGTSCPECGRPFDPDDLSTVRIDGPSSKEKPPWTSRYSLMLGIISLVLFCIPLVAPMIAIAAIICGHCALHTIKHKRKTIGPGVAIAGLIVGYLGLVIGVLMFAVMIMRVQ